MKTSQVRALLASFLFCISAIGLFLAAEPNPSSSFANCKVCGAAIKQDGSQAGIQCLEQRPEGFKKCKVTLLEGEEAASCKADGGACPGTGGGGGGIDPN